MWPWKRVPRDLKLLRKALRRIETAPVQLRPFPHIVVFDALPAGVFARIKAHWPDRSTMWREHGHDRFWAYQESNDIWRRWEWSAIKADVIDPMFAAIATRLRPYFDARFSGRPSFEPRLLALHEAGPCFVEHKPHTHFEHNPEYAFTMLYCVDDAGARDRGTTLYGYHELPAQMTGDDDRAIMHRASGRLAFYSRPDVVVPFEPNRLLAFVDGPHSIHGSTPFTPSLELTGRRRMILSHVAGRAARDEAQFYIDQFNAYRAGNDDLHPTMRALLEIERKVLASWRV
jgi:hypothetical protein